MSGQFSCFIIGMGSHLVSCAEILLQRGHRICGIISSGPPVIDWAQRNSVPLIDAHSDFAAFLCGQPFDYLFSIVYPAIIPSEVLALPRRGAINFHDGPLPRYAGLNATSWALINQEQMHGITWHMMSTAVDAGDVLKQRQVAMLEDDTAFRLNVRCYEAAIEAFAELVDELSSGRAKPWKQDLTCRSYFGKSRRPPAACVLRWNQPARKIAALVRALDFGPYPNPLGVAKLIIANQVFLVPEVRVSPGVSRCAPGTITAVNENGVVVSTTDDQIVLNRLLTFTGRSVSAMEAVHQCGLAEGGRLTELDLQTMDALHSLDEKLSRHETFWVRRLANQNPVALPPMDRSSVAAGPPRYAIVRTSLPAELIALLEARDDTTWSDLLTVAFAAYVGRISGTYTFDLLFGHSDLHPQVARDVSVFATGVPLHVELVPQAGLHAARQTLAEELTRVKRHGTYARDVVLRYPELHPLRTQGDPDVSPLAVEQVAGEESRMPDSRLTLRIRQDNHQLQWIYDDASYKRETIDRIQRQFLTFLEGTLADDTKPLADVAVLSDAERRQLLKWNSTWADYPQEACIHQMFEAQSGKTPGATAVAFEDGQLTYGELNRRANQLAHLLRALGVGPDGLVGVYMERSLEMLIGLLGILKAGGAYLPVDPEFPKKRIDYMLDHSQVAVLLTQERMKEPLGRSGVTMICLDRDGEAISQQSEQNPPCATRPEHLAYVIYTSGSTGDPKGVQIPHGAVVNFLASMQREPGLTADDVLLAVTTLSFDISVLELFLPLTVGAKAVIVGREIASDGGRILEAMDRHRVTMMQATPATWRLMMAAGWKGSGRLKVLCGGEALPQNLAGDLLRRAAEVWNMYGPTETTVWSTCYRLTDPEGPILIGRPIANTQIYILDDFLQPVPIGVPGEIYIGGAGVTRGYLKAPDLTAERFVAHPFRIESVPPSNRGQEARDSGMGFQPMNHRQDADATKSRGQEARDTAEARVYKTGDFGRYRHDGNIEFLGRMDNQVKVRGFRIEMGEIEAALTKHAHVCEAAVATREDGFGNVRLVGYVVPAPGDRPTVESLREFLQDRLPYYMVPEIYVMLEALPLTPNGKVDRKRLPEPDYARPQMKQAYIAPSTGYEQALSEIWRQVLSVDRVGVHDNFFDLGGNSLLGVQAVMHMRQKLDIAIPIIKLFQCPTIASLAKCLDRADDDPKPIGDIESRAQRRRAVLSRRRSSPKLSPPSTGVYSDE